MVTLLLHLLRFLPMLCGGHRQVALENLALRHQLAVYKKMVNRPKLLSSDRLFWVALSRVWAGWRIPSWNGSSARCGAIASTISSSSVSGTYVALSPRISRTITVHGLISRSTRTRQT